jgi:hypothetical protein
MSQLLVARAQPVCRTVYGYVLGFTDQHLVLGIQQGGLWQLPGGPVEGDDTPDASDVVVPSDSADPLRFGPLALHIRNQTGLTLERLSPVFAVNTHPPVGGYFDMSLFYLATASGQRTGGTPLSSSNLPSFSADCPAEPAMIRAFLRTGNPLTKTRWWQLWLGK